MYNIIFSWFVLLSLSRIAVICFDYNYFMYFRPHLPQINLGFAFSAFRWVKLFSNLYTNNLLSLCDEFYFFPSHWILVPFCFSHSDPKCTHHILQFLCMFSMYFSTCFYYSIYFCNKILTRNSSDFTITFNFMLILNRIRHFGAFLVVSCKIVTCQIL